MKRLLLALFAACMAAYGTNCVILDTLRNFDDTLYTGRIVITLNAPESSQPLYTGTTTLTGWQRTLAVSAGVVSVTLVCNDSITPGGTSYTASYSPAAGAPWREIWIAATGTTTVRDMRSTTVPSRTMMFAPSQISAGGAVALQYLQYSGTSWGAVTLSALSDPTTTAGDVIYRAAGGLTRLGIGTLGHCMTAGASAPTWAACGGGGGIGTVTSVSVTSAGGVSGTVATATTTPAITLTLGAITPTSVVASGAVSGSNLSGTNTGDQATISGNAGTATALAANGANCSAGSFPLGVDAAGASETCTALPTAITGTANQITASAATGTITLSIPTSPTLPGTTTGTFSGNLTGNVTGNTSGSSGSTTGNAGTATALAANPADCAANNFATTIAANGDLVCAQPSISAGVSGLAANVATMLATPSSANLIAALTDETGTGASVFATSPTFVTPLLGTPTSVVLTNATGTAASLTAGAATILATARNIAGVSFNGSANISIPSTGLSDTANLVRNNAANTWSTGAQVFTAASLRVPNSVSLPGTCTVGDSYMDTDATTGQRWYLCESTDTWAVQGGAGGGASDIAGLTDLRVTRTSGTVVAVAAGVNVKGNTATVITAATVTITAGSGNGTVLIYISEGDVITVEHPTATGLSITCTACTANQVTTPVIPANSRYLGSVTVTAGAWVTVTDRRGLGSRPLVSGTGISIVDTGGVATINIDTADVPRLGATNAFTGTIDASSGVALVQPRGSGVPAAGGCDAASEVGGSYVNNANGGLAYDCRQTGAGVYSWVSRGGSSAAFSFINRDTAQTFDEFAPGSTTTLQIGALGWGSMGTGGVTTTNMSTATHPGVYRSVSGTSANDGAGFRLDTNADAFFLATPSTGNWDSLFIFKPVFTGNVSHYLIGWVNDIADLPARGAYVRAYNSASGCSANNNSEGTFQFTNRDASTSTASASTQTITTDVWYSLRIRSTTNGTILYSLAKGDGAPETEVSIASNAPATGVSPVFLAITCDSNTVQIHADYFAFQMTGLTR